MKFAFNHRRELEGLQRVACELEKIVVEIGRFAQYFGHQGGHAGLCRGQKFERRPVGARDFDLALGKAFAIQLAVGRQRHFFDHHDMRRNHVCGQYRLQPLFDLVGQKDGPFAL